MDREFQLRYRGHLPHPLKDFQNHGRYPHHPLQLSNGPEGPTGDWGIHFQTDEQSPAVLQDMVYRCDRGK